MVIDVQEIKEQLTQILSADNKSLSPKETLGMVPEANIDSEINTIGSTAALNLNSHKSTKHALLLKSNESDETYSAETWAEIVKEKLPNQISNIPVTQTKLTKQGCGYLVFPDQKSRDNAANNLKSYFNVESKDNLPKHLSLKIKICNLPEDSYSNTKDGLQQLKDDILRKNEAVRALVKDEGKQFDILFIKHDHNRNDPFAVAKVDASI